MNTATFCTKMHFANNAIETISTLILLLLCYFSAVNVNAQPCQVAGGTVSTTDPTASLCLNDGNNHPVALTASGNSGLGRFGLVEAGTGLIVASNNTGIFEMTAYPPGQYLLGYVAVQSVSTLSGLTNISQLMGCYALSNSVPVSTFRVEGGSIAALSPTVIASGVVEFAVAGNTGLISRWALLNEVGSEILEINTSGSFNIDNYPLGSYKVVHASLGQGINPSMIDPLSLQGCIDISNILQIEKVNPLAPYPPGTLHCSTTPAEVVEVLNPITGKTWMDRNLGASQAATALNDEAAYGDLYQWGRFSDGHQCRISTTTNVKSSTDTPGNNQFITSNFPSDYDWRKPQNSNLWQGAEGINNPCPQGFRIPTEPEFNAEKNTWASTDIFGGYASPLKFVAAGFRSYNGGFFGVGGGYYWSSSTGNQTGTNSRFLITAITSAAMGNGVRAFGMSVRCIQD